MLKLGSSRRALERAGVTLGTLIALATALGCGGDAGPKTVRVKGLVTYNGAPLTKGQVTFSPVDANQGRVASAPIGSDGRFVPTTIKHEDGLMVGDYRVAVTSYAVGPGNTPPPVLAKMKDGGLAIPKKYIDVTSSGLSVKVTEADSGKEFKLELTD
jgi:hypothetical protein